MDPQVPASFIPKKPFMGESRSRGVGLGLFFLLALLIFIASIISAGGAFAYLQYLTASKNAKADSLVKAEGAYDPAVIQDLLRLDSRLGSAQLIINKHVAPSALFAFLSGATLTSVQFTSFGYGLGADGSAKMTLTGVADSFSAVALQSDEFGASKVLKDVVFSNIAVNQDGAVTFSVDATVNPSLILYTKNLSQNSALPTSLPATQPSTPAATSTTP